MSPTSESDFLRAICEAPADEATRLVYADWLEEHGELARAELIQTQSALVSLAPGDPARLPLAERERKILRKNRAGWQVGAPLGAGKGDFAYGFHVPRLKASCEAFLRLSPEQLYPCPLWSFTLTRVRGLEAALAASPLLARAFELNLVSCNMQTEGTTTLASSPRLQAVEKLGLSRNWMGSQGLAAVVRHLDAPRLRELDLGGNYVGDDDVVRTLAAAPWLARITHLRLSKNSIGDQSAEALAASPHTDRLVDLDLSETNTGDGAACAVAAGSLPSLRRLALGRQLTAAGVRALVGSPVIDQLEHLSIPPERLSRVAHALLAALGDRVTFLRA